ncbi:TRAP transporter, 4TM/12TM fusion protein,unknown substrate 1 [Crocosphaera watsonii WH 0401]|uniref:Uncharacterized protein n=1 Tax=Crocosphaera watsonii WH 0401 TaxID=555881 RepID=T2JH62_CROWT|nr:TRAP transporter, 4TM/12TM fusion protein,unknown substrate 1 [Crocosphaera watsonii WH 0401]
MVIKVSFLLLLTFLLFPSICLNQTSVKIIPTITSWWVIAVELKADIILELLEKQASGIER